MSHKSEASTFLPLSVPPSTHLRLPIFCHFPSDNKVLLRLNLKKGDRTKVCWGDGMKGEVGNHDMRTRDGWVGGEADGEAKWRAKEMMVVMRNTAQEVEEWEKIAGRLKKKKEGYQKKTWG